MAQVSIRELRNSGGMVIDRVAAGEEIVITRAGRPVAELRAVRADPVPAEVLLARWQRLPKVDLEDFRADLDEVIDAAL